MRHFHTRSDTDDIEVVRNVWERHEYVHPGYEITPGQVVVDVGAHIGAFAVWAADKGAHVTAYEPDSRNYHVLQQNIAEWGVDVTAVQKAVAKNAGVHKFWPNALPTMGSLTRVAGDHIDVECVTLADIVGDGCDLLKLDAEGAEYEIIVEGDAETLRRIERIMLEWHDSRDWADILIWRLSNAGFVIDRYMHEMLRMESPNRFNVRGKVYARRGAL